MRLTWRRKRSSISSPEVSTAVLLRIQVFLDVKLRNGIAVIDVTFQRILLLLSSELKMFLGLLNVEDEGTTNVRNVGNLSPNETTSLPKRPASSRVTLSLLPLTSLLPASLNPTASFVCHTLSSYCTLNFGESEFVWHQVYFQLPLDISTTSVEAGPKIKRERSPEMPVNYISGYIAV